MTVGELDGEIRTDDTLRERTQKNRLKQWLLLDANRFAVLAALATLVFGSFVLVGALSEPSLRDAVRSTDTIDTIFSTMISVLVTGTTLVVTINQIILSQENGPLGDQHSRMNNAMDAREFTSELLGSTAPAEPSTLLEALVDETAHRAKALRQAAADNDNGELREQVDEFVDNLLDNAEKVSEHLDGADFGTFEVLSAALDYNYSRKIHQVQRMSNEFESRLDEDERAAFRELETSLTMFGPVREHIKTLYFQWALVDLSQYILYAAVPALVVAACMVAFVGQGSFPGSTAGIADITWVVGGAFTVTTIPFLLFTSYILRIAVTAKQTLAIEPLILR